MVGSEHKGILSCPWVALGAVCGGRSELLGVEAGDGGARCHCDGSMGVSTFLEDREHERDALVS